MYCGIKINPKDDYESIKKYIIDKRIEFEKEYNNCNDRNTKQRLIDSAGKFITYVLINKLIPHWYGTQWCMSGYSEIPNTGSVGCSYFVSTNLKHSGFNIDRYKMAQAAAFDEVKTITITDSALVFKNQTIDFIYKQLSKLNQEGLYILGLKNHVGFMYFIRNELFFIHSSYTFPNSVVIEDALDSRLLQGEIAQFALGKITNNHNLIKKWLLNEEIKVITSDEH